MDTQHLLKLAETYAAHIGRGLYTLANKVGVHSRFFTRLAEKGECRPSAYRHALDWFDANWPADLEWPRDIPRPSKAKKKEAA
jgi:hypothetical protein